MDLLGFWLAVLAGAALTFYPMFDASKHDENAGPWILGGLLTGPLSGVVYLMVRRSRRLVAERNGTAVEATRTAR